MNAKEKESVASYGQLWVDAIDRQTAAMDRQTAALKYLADVLGFKADGLNPKDDEGKAIVTLEMSVAEEIPPEPEVTLAEIKQQLNLLARAKGKDAALEMLGRFAPSKNPADLDPGQYAEIASALKVALL